MTPPRLVLAICCTVIACGSLRADVALAPLFTDHAVLQRDKAVPIWGRADPGEKVTVAFAGQSVSTNAGKDGRWMVQLAPLPANSVGADLVVAGRNSVALHDILVGEVWICSGQSNMEFLVHGTNLRLLNSDREVAAANHPLIRHFKVAHDVAEAPVETASGSWAVCSPATVGQFTAVGYFFGREISRKLQVPVGLINSSWGGTQIESWMSADTLQSDPAFAEVGRRWRKALEDYPAAMAAYSVARPAWEKARAAAAAGGPARLAAFLQTNHRPNPPPGPGSPDTPSGLFNGMIQPLIPFAIRGAIWYQGESNAPRASAYHRLFAAMISSWREKFGQGDFPFFWVQLANFGRPDDPTHETWAYLREAQSQALSLPATGQAVAIDIGDPRDIHPTNKQEVGRRLALIAKALVYGTSVDYSGPVFASAVREGGALRVRFKYAGTGLTAGDRPLESFEVAGADRRFHPASAVIVGDTLRVQSPEVPEPVAVRYAWRNAPDANLYNGAGLPASPFRSDSW